MFESTFFKQIEEAAVRFPLFPVVANLYMEAFGEKALETLILQLKLWVGYVDDTFVLWKHEEDDLETFHQHLNLQHPSFHQVHNGGETGEDRISGCPSWEEGRKISMEVYRKNTHTDRYFLTQSSMCKHQSRYVSEKESGEGLL